MPGMRTYGQAAEQNLDPESFVESDSRDREAATQQSLAQSIPEAREPLKPATIRSAQQTLTRALKALGVTGKGQMAPPAFQPVQGPQERVPPDLGSFILGLGQFIEDNGEALPMIADYAFDPIEVMESNAGLDSFSAILDGMAQDEALAEALQSGPEAPEEEVEEEAEPPADDEGELLPPEEE